MLSYSSALVLGIIAEKPINPYEMKKLLEKISIRKWMPIAASSLYATIRTLSGASLIDCEAAKDGNMPEKKVYSINDAGRKSLHDTISSFLSSTDLDGKKLRIAMLMICHLTKAEAIEAAQKKIKKLENAEIMLKRIFTSFESSMSVPYTAILTMKHEYNLVQAELTTTKELLANILGDDNWDHFITNIA
jgi:DNA-binding PadR family transcriptional regulator